MFIDYKSNKNYQKNIMKFGQKVNNVIKKEYGSKTAYNEIK